MDSIFRSTRGIRFWRRRSLPAAAQSHVEPMMCDCGEDHPDRPDGLRLRRVPDPDGLGGRSISKPVVRLSPGPAHATESDLRAVQQRDRLLRDGLPRVRAAAAA